MKHQYREREVIMADLVFNREDFIKKWRNKFGCDCTTGLCWCDVCRKLEKIWGEMIKISIEKLKELK